MTLPLANLPVIELSSADESALARTLDRACRDIGFIVVSGHGVPEPVLQAAFDAALPIVSHNGFVEMKFLEYNLAKPAFDVGQVAESRQTAVLILCREQLPLLPSKIRSPCRPCRPCRRRACRRRRPACLPEPRSPPLRW